MKTATQALEYERTPIRLGNKTNLRRSIDKEKFDKMYLKDASLFYLLKHVWRRYNSQIVYLIAVLGWAWAIYQAIN